MSKLNAGKASVLALTAVFAVSAFLLGKSLTSVSAITPDCGTETYNFTRNGSNSRVSVNFDSNFQIDAIGQNGWSITNLWLDENGGGENFISYGSGDKSNFNPSNMRNIGTVRVEVYKACATASPTASATATPTVTPTATPTVTPTPTSIPTPASVNIVVCHKDGQSGNYSRVDVSIHSVDDFTGPNGHGNHSEDIWRPFIFNGTNFAGQGDYNNFDFNTCNPIQSTPTPNPTASPTASPTTSPTAIPTASPTASPEASASPEATPTSSNNTTTSTTNDGGDGLGCATHDCSGNTSNTPQGQVLGASTMAGTGSFDETFYQAIMSIGATLSAFGLKGLKKTKKTSKK